MRKMRINLRQDYANILPMKLPTPRKRGDAYRIEIMIDGKRMSATRDTIKECHASTYTSQAKIKTAIAASLKMRLMRYL